MSIWLNEDMRIIVQGATGDAGRVHTKQMLEAGSLVVAGVTPGKGGMTVLGLPVFDTVKEAVEKTGATASIILVPARNAADAMIEAIDACLDLVVCITEHVPVRDMMLVKQYLKGRRTRLIGPNCSGIISPQKSKLGIMPNQVHKKGNVGIVSRSGTLTYEAAQLLSEAGLGQSTVVGIGGDAIKGTGFIEVLEAFHTDRQTKSILLIGEIGGDEEERAAAWIKANMKKPVVAYIAGLNAPEGKKMGHAGAIVSGNQGTAVGKIKALSEAGVKLAESLSEITALLKD